MADLKLGTQIAGHLVWHQGVLKLNPTDTNLYFKEWDVITSRGGQTINGGITAQSITSTTGVLGNGSDIGWGIQPTNVAFGQKIGSSTGAHWLAGSMLVNGSIRSGIQVRSDDTGAVRIYTNKMANYVEVLNGQITIQASSPSAVGHATRKDYVDTQIQNTMDYVDSEVSGVDSSLTALSNASVKLTGDQSISGVKSFTTLPTASSDPTSSTQLVRKSYADLKVAKTGDTMTGQLIVSTPTSTPGIKVGSSTHKAMFTPSSISGEYVFGGADDGGNVLSSYIRVGSTRATIKKGGGSEFNIVTEEGGFTVAGAMNFESITATSDVFSRTSIGATNPNDSNASVTLKFVGDIATIRYGGSGTGAMNGFRVCGTSDTVKMMVDNSGEIYAAGSYKVYHTNNKPTAADVEALASTGGTLSGNILFSDSGTAKRGIQGTSGTNDQWFVGGGATASNTGYMEISTGDDGTEPIYVRQYTGAPLTGTVARTLTLLNESGNTALPGILYMAKDKYIDFAANTSGGELRVGGNGRTVTADGVSASIAASTGNLHIDAASGKNLYLNWYAGSSVLFGNGAGSGVGSIDTSGNLSMNGNGTFGGGLTITGVTSGQRFSGYGIGNTYTSGAFEARGNGSTNTIYPTVGFHQPNMYAGSIQMRADAEFTFYRTDSSTKAHINASAGRFDGAVGGARFYTGYDSGQANSVSCSNWFRSSGTTGWYNATYAGGIYMEDTTWVRTYGTKKFYVDNTGADAIYTLGGVKANGGFYDNGQRVYSPLNKPTADDVGANLAVGGTGGVSVMYARIAQVVKAPGSGVAGFTALVGGGGNYGSSTAIGMFLIQASTRGYSDGSAAIRAYSLSPIPSNVVFYAVDANGFCEIWMRTETYCYGVNVIPLQATGASFVPSYTSTAPTTIRVTHSPVRAYSPENIPTAADVGALATTANAVSASKWATARTLSLAGDATGSVSMDGSGNVTLTVAVADDSHNHVIGNVDGLQAALDAKLGSSSNAVSASKWATARTLTLAGDATGSVSMDGSGNVTLTVAVADDSHAHVIGNVDGLQAALDAKLGSSSNAVSASKWATARTLSLTGDITGSASIDGSGNVSLATTLAVSSGDRGAGASTIWSGSYGSHPTTITLINTIGSYKKVRFEGVNSDNTIAWSVTYSYDEWNALCATGKTIYIACGAYTYQFASTNISSLTLSRVTSTNCYLTKIVGLS